MTAVDVERIERAIAVTAYCMTRHKLPQLLPTLKRLEAERDQLTRDGDALDYASRVLERGAISVDRCRTIPSPPLADVA